MTSRLLRAQCITLFPSLAFTTPHCNGIRDTEVSFGSGWQAALRAAELLPTNGIPGVYLRKPFRSPEMTARLPTMMAQNMAVQEYPTVEIDLSSSRIPSLSYTVTKAKNSDCDISQWSVPDNMSNGWLRLDPFVLFSGIWGTYYSIAVRQLEIVCRALICRRIRDSQVYS